MTSHEAEHSPAERILRHYLHRLQDNDGKDRPFPNIFATYFGAVTDSSKAMEDYLQRFDSVSLHWAEQLNALEENIPCRDRLGIRSPDELVVCVAIAIYLRENDHFLGQYFDHLSESDQKRISKGRKEILKRLRFFLMQQKDLESLATPSGHDTPGYGAERAGQPAYTHFGREALVFSLFGYVFGPATLAEIRACLNKIDPNGDFRLSNPIKCLIKLFDPILWSIGRDLSASKRRGTATRPDAARGNPDIDIDSLPYQKDPLSELIEERDGEVEKSGVVVQPADAYASLLRAKREIAVIKQYLKREKNSARHRVFENRLKVKLEEERRYTQNIHLSGTSKPLLPSAENILCYYAPLRRVIDHAEETSESIVFSGKKTSFKFFFRLHIAFQLLSWFTDYRYSAADRQRLVEDLGQVFERTDDRDTGNALEVFSSLSDERELWGPKPSGGYNYTGLVRHISRQVLEEAFLASTEPILEPLRQKAYQALREVLDTNASVLHEDICFDASESMVEALHEIALFEMHHGQELSAKFEVLENHLMDLLLFTPGSLQYCYRQMQELIGWIEKPKWDDFGWLNRVRDAIREGQIILLKTTNGKPDTEQLRLLVVGQINLKLLTRVRAPEFQDLLKMEPDKHLKRVMGFFRQQYASNIGGEGGTWKREEWEFMAYKLCFSSGLDHYESLYRRISDRCYLTLGLQLNELYSQLIDRNDLANAFGQMVHACVLGEDNPCNSVPQSC